MLSPEIEEFGRILVEKVRDAAIRCNDMTLEPRAMALVAKRWREAARENSPETFARSIIPDVVDATIFYLLQAIDQEFLRLSFPASNGRSVDLAAEGRGELSGSYMGGEEGWRAKYTKERFVDDTAHLRDFFSHDAGMDDETDEERGGE